MVGRPFRKIPVRTLASRESILVARALRRLARAGDIPLSEALRFCPQTLRELPLRAMQNLFQQPGNLASGILSANMDRRPEDEEPDDYLYQPTERVWTAVSATLQSASSRLEGGGHSLQA